MTEPLPQCLTECNQTNNYLWEHQPQKILLLRMLQDVCSVTGNLPSLYRLQGRPRVDYDNPLGSGAHSGVYRIISDSPDAQPLAARIAHSGGSSWASDGGREVVKASLSGNSQVGGQAHFILDAPT